MKWRIQKELILVQWQPALALTQEGTKKAAAVEEGGVVRSFELLGSQVLMAQRGLPVSCSLAHS